MNEKDRAIGGYYSFRGDIFKIVRRRAPADSYRCVVWDIEWIMNKEATYRYSWFSETSAMDCECKRVPKLRSLLLYGEEKEIDNAKHENNGK